MEDRRESTRGKKAESYLDGILCAATTFTIVSYLFCEVYALDIWWHIAIGMDILDKGMIPRFDSYTVAGLGRNYHDSQWLFQLVMALAHRGFGWVGIQAVQAALWIGSLVLCYRSLRRRIPVSSALLLIILLAGASFERFLPRPELVSFFMISAFLYILRSRNRNTPLSIGLLFMLQAVWSNCHGLFVVGPFMIGIYWLWDLVSWKSIPYRFPIRSTVSLVLVLLASLCGPYGWDVWEYAALLFREASISDLQVFDTLGELSPILGAAFRMSPAFWFFLILLALSAVGFAYSLRTRKLSPGHLILLAMLALAFTGRRNVVLFCLAAIPMLVEPTALTRFFNLMVWRNLFFRIILLLCILAGSWFSLSGVYYLKMEFPARTGAGVTPSFFPHGLKSFVEKHDFRGPVLNSNSLGGFWLYTRFPESLPLTDGRWEVQDPDNLQWILNNSRSRFGWKEVARRYETTGILLAHTSPEAAAILPSIRSDSDWKLVYLDRAASFWVSTLAWQDIPALDLRDPAIMPATPRIDDRLILESFLKEMGAPGLRMKNLKQLFDAGWRRREIGLRLGMLQIEAQDYSGAEKTFRELVRDDSNNAVALNELAYLHYLKRDTAAAVRYIDRALEIDPDNANYLKNRQRIMDLDRRRNAPSRDESR